MKATTVREIQVWRNADHNYAKEVRKWGQTSYEETTNIFEAILNSPGLYPKIGRMGFSLVTVKLTMVAEEIEKE